MPNNDKLIQMRFVILKTSLHKANCTLALKQIDHGNKNIAI